MQILLVNPPFPSKGKYDKQRQFHAFHHLSFPLIPTNNPNPSHKKTARARSSKTVGMHNIEQSFRLEGDHGGCQRRYLLEVTVSVFEDT
jgi:hypothetical protein